MQVETTVDGVELEDLLTPAQVAESLALSKQTLAKWRCYGMGPPFIRVNGAIRYSPRAVETWLRERAS
ncbi:MAG: helix-turn-helix domain-containing protein [Acidobacteriota bacterium]|nr:helix-turn-helix domain-containing protein [Acidobacteriota bacterium]